MITDERTTIAVSCVVLTMGLASYAVLLKGICSYPQTDEMLEIFVMKTLKIWLTEVERILRMRQDGLELPQISNHEDGLEDELIPKISHHEDELIPQICNPKGDDLNLLCPLLQPNIDDALFVMRSRYPKPSLLRNPNLDGVLPLLQKRMTNL